MENKKKALDWVNLLFLTLTPLIAVVGVGYLFLYDHVHWATWVLTVLMTAATGIGITGGYHRLFSHRSYDASWIVRLFYLLFGAASFQNSARKWCSDHRTHHKNTDSSEDPYNIQEGFWYAHIGWIFYKKNADYSYDHNIPDLMNDPLVRFQDRHYFVVAALVGFGLPTLLASFWGNAWGGLFLAGFARVVLNHHFTFSVNSFCHFLGRQPYSSRNSSKDSWITALFTYGEGYHNFHHTFQADYRNGIRAYHWDPTKWLINALASFKLAWNLKVTPQERILKARLQRHQEIMLARMASAQGKASHLTQDLIEGARKRLEEAHARMDELGREYQLIKKDMMRGAHEKFHSMHESMHDKIHAIKMEMQATRQGMSEAAANWAALCRMVGMRSDRLL